MEGQDFNQMNPPKSVTDPLGLGLNPDYPRHLHKAGFADDGVGPLYLVVTSPQEEADAVAEGWLREKPAPTYAAAKRGPAPKRAGG